MYSFLEIHIMKIAFSDDFVHHFEQHVVNNQHIY